MNVLFELLETIMSDHPNTEENLSDPDNILHFADVCGYTITEKTAVKIAEVGRAWLAYARQKHEP